MNRVEAMPNYVNSSILAASFFLLGR